MRSLIAALLCFLAPVLLRAETPRLRGDSLDAWRADLKERLDRDIAQLSASPPPALPALPAVEGDKEGKALPRSASFPQFKVPRNPAWLPTVAAILRDQGLPAGLVGIPAVESDFNPVALSPKGARGLWQLMPETAKRFGLVVNAGRDERIDPLKSTFVAAQYLKILYAQFRDWPLVLAAYNTGEDRVQRSLERFGARDFWTLSRQSALPDETRRYVPAVLTRLGGPLSPLDLALRASPALAGRETQILARPSDEATRTQVVFALTSQGFDTSASIE
jgi:soluble lytic murein transglycosylase-like protein